MTALSLETEKPEKDQPKQPEPEPAPMKLPPQLPDWFTKEDWPSKKK